MSALTDAILGNKTQVNTPKASSSLVSQILANNKPRSSGTVPSSLPANKSFIQPVSSTSTMTSTPQSYTGGTARFLAEVAGYPLRAGLRAGQTIQEAANPGSTSPINPKQDLGGYASYFLGESPIESLQSTLNRPDANPIDYIGQTGEVALGLLPLYGSLASRAATLANKTPLLTKLAVSGEESISRGPTITRITDAAVRPPSSVLQPLLEIPQPIKPAGKVSKVASSIESKSIEDGLTKSFDGLAEYDPITIKDQARRAAEVLADRGRVERIIAGVEELPAGLRGGSFIKSVEDLALKEGDSELARKLASSKLTSDTSIYAQELRTLAERNPDSAVAIMQDIARTRKLAADKRVLGGSAKATKATANIIKSEITKKATKQTWDEFVDQITC